MMLICIINNHVVTSHANVIMVAQIVVEDYNPESKPIYTSETFHCVNKSYVIKSLPVRNR